MKTDAFFEDLNGKENVLVIKDVDNSIKESFERKYPQYKDKFFYEQFTRCGGIIIDNWIRLYGCGALNVMEKNEKYNVQNEVEILIGEDVLGGLFGLKDENVYYFAPDTNKWENLAVYYTPFIDWLVNRPNNVNQFYELFRWNSWKEDSKNLKITALLNKSF